jgi:hypothetical protein
MMCYNMGAEMGSQCSDVFTGSCYFTGCPDGYKWDGFSCVQPAPYAQSYYQGYYQSGYYSQSYYQSYYQSTYGPPPPTFNCTPSSLTPGGSSTCTWSCPAGSTGSAGTNLSTGGAVSGNVVVRPTDTTQYTVQCTIPGGPTSANQTVTVTGMSLSLSANPTRVRAGNASTITWSATQASSCTLTGPSVSTSCSSLATCASSHNTSTGALSTASRYTLTCQGASGARSASVLVNIIPAQTEI